MIGELILSVYQARNGKIYVRNGISVTPLTQRQIGDLRIAVDELDDFDLDSYQAAYAPQTNGNDGVNDGRKHED